MDAALPIRKFSQTSVLTSGLIGLVAIASHAILNSIPIIWLLKIGVLVTCLFLVISFMNIGVIILANKSKVKNSAKRIRYILSFSGALVIAALSILLSHHFQLYTVEINELMDHSKIASGKDKIHAYIILILALNSVVILILDLVHLRDRKNRVELEMAELKIQHIAAKNEQLKQQIHPHFLFNSLSTLKSLIHKNPEKAETYLLKLSDFLRASILPNAELVVKLKEEIQLSQDYLEMQQMRFGNALRFTIDIPFEKLESTFVPAFSILPLLENAVKHNQLTIEQPLSIHIAYDKEWVTVKNNKQIKQYSEPSTGFGLSNLRKRYALLSGEDIKVTDNETYFSVSIKTLENENSYNRR